MHSGAETFIGFLVIVAILIGIFMLIRGLMLWYWRINDIVDRLDKIVAAVDKTSASKNEP